ncbi:MAG: hypothetical protein GX657_09290, partial [Chloroflexi bacterium]|nr:hypothetical protein [Chloroflexota bacterium]
GGLSPVEATASEDRAICDALRAVFGAYRVLGLERLMESTYRRPDVALELQRLGYDPREVLATAVAPQPVYPENASRAEAEALRALLVCEALDYGLLCSVTGFVAVRKEQGVPVEGTAEIGNALPQGWEGEMFLNAMSAPPTSVASFLRDAGTPRMMAGHQQARQVMSDVPAFSRRLPRPTAASQPIRYAGTPLTGAEGAAVLFDTGHLADASVLTGDAEFRWLALRGLAGSLTLKDVPRGLVVVLEIDGSEVARIAVVDVIRRGGQARIRVRCSSSQHLRVLLVDPDHGWETAAPEIEVLLT